MNALNIAIRTVTFALILLCLETSGWTQELKKPEVILHLKKGLELRGTLISFTPGVETVLVSIYGDTTIVPEYLLKKVQYVQRYQVKEKPMTRPYSFREKGLYHATSASVSFNTVSRDQGGLVGYAFSTVVGHQFKRLLGVGLGLGADFYTPGADEKIFPLYGELRGYFLKQPVTPFYNLRVGYGFAFRNEDIGIVSADGGYFLNPSLGYRLSGRNGMNVVLEMGLKFQKAAFERFEGSERSEIEIFYKRLNVGLGFLF